MGLERSRSGRSALGGDGGRPEGPREREGEREKEARRAEEEGRQAEGRGGGERSGIDVCMSFLFMILIPCDIFCFVDIFFVGIVLVLE